MDLDKLEGNIEFNGDQVWTTTSNLNLWNEFDFKTLNK
jgi:hypothetical protein